MPGGAGIPGGAGGAGIPGGAGGAGIPGGAGGAGMPGGMRGIGGDGTAGFASDSSSAMTPQPTTLNPTPAITYTTIRTRSLRDRH